MSKPQLKWTSRNSRTARADIVTWSAGRLVVTCLMWYEGTTWTVDIGTRGVVHEAIDFDGGVEPAADGPVPDAVLVAAEEKLRELGFKLELCATSPKEES